MTAKVALNPMGSFEVKTKRIRGAAVKKGAALQAVGLEISVKSFDTDNETRDDHLKEKLEYKKYPNIVVEKAVGKGGKGQAIIKVRNIKKKVPFTYSEKGKEVEVNFSISLKDYGITGINYMGVGVQDEVKINASIPLK
tara:strand:+ start:435 stop:851 length:417 start_codon:yes stop_codon:yes gene_type:complete